MLSFLTMLKKFKEAKVQELFKNVLLISHEYIIYNEDLKKNLLINIISNNKNLLIQDLNQKRNFEAESKHGNIKSNDIFNGVLIMSIICY